MITKWLLEKALILKRGDDIRVLMFIMARMGLKRSVVISQKAIADTLDIDPSRVSRSVRTLIREGLITRGGPNGTNNTYKAHPSLM